MKLIVIISIFTNILLANTGSAQYAKCAGCHGAEGQRSALGKSVAIGGQSASKTIEQLKGYQESLNLYGMGGLMKGQVASMSDKDISLVATYIEQLKGDGSQSNHKDINSQLSLCAEEKDDKKRLNCFDKLSKQSTNSGPIPREKDVDKITPPKKADKGKWNVSISTSEIDDSQKVILSLSANNTIYSSYRSERPTLLLRCSENKTEAYINWNVFLGSDSIKVLLRYDKEKARTKWWGLSTDHKATFVRGNIPFIKKLLKHKKLLVNVTPYSDSPVSVTFDLNGLDEAVKPLRKACHW